MKKTIIIMIIVNLLLLVNIKSKLVINEQVDFTIDIVKILNKKALIIQKDTTVLLVPFSEYIDSNIERYVLSKYKNINIVSKDKNYSIDNINIINEYLLKVNDIVCVDLSYEESDVEDCMILFIDESIIDKEYSLNEQIQLIIHENNNLNNETLEEIYFNWIDTFLIKDNTSISITIYEDNKYTLSENKISVN